MTKTIYTVFGPFLGHEHLLQTVSSPILAQQPADWCSNNMRSTYASILQVSHIGDSKWADATIPPRMGIFGLRDPRTIVQLTRLASLTNVLELAYSLGASQPHVQAESAKALSAYMTVVQSDICPQLTPSRDLQRLLTQPLHQATLAALVNCADEPTKLRLNSLATPHATAWLSASPYVSAMTSAEHRSGHLWVGGHNFHVIHLP